MASATTERIYKLTVDATAAVNKLDQIAKSTGAVEQKMTKAGSAMDMAFKGVAAAGALVGVAASMQKFLSYADKLADTADAFGTSATAIKAWGNAIQQAGGDAEKTDKLFQKTSELITQIVDEKAPDSIKKLGISFKDIKGLNVEESFDLIVQRLAQIDDNASRSATAMDIFGKAAIGVDFKKLAADAALLDKNIGDFEVNIRAAADAADYLAGIFKKAMGLGASMIGSFANDINRFKAMVDEGKWIPLEEWNQKIADGIKKGAEESKVALEKLRTTQNNLAKADNGSKERAAELEKLNRAIEQQVLAQIKWEDAMLNSINPMREIDANLAKLQTALDSGRISWEQYSDIMFKIMETPTEKLKEITSEAEAIADAIAQNANNAMNTFIDSIGKAKLDFGDMAAAMLKDIAKMIIQLTVMKPLMNMVKGGLGISATQALGGAWKDGVQFFANGGVVTTPTAFGMAGGKMGVMGEAGAEVIAPLKRNSAGQMGVGASPTTVNVINNGGNQVDVSERNNSDGSKQIDILITQKVKDMFNTGVMDKTMSTNFGARRVGW